MKYVKRIFVVIFALIALVIAWVQVQDNSELFASDMVHLRCTTIDVGGEFSTPAVRDAYFKDKPIILGRLQEDWIRDRVLLQWIADEDVSEDGLEGIKTLITSVQAYSGWDFEGKVQRTINRNTLVYYQEFKEYSSSTTKWWKKRQCEVIDKSVFEEQRRKVVAATIAAQKI